MSSNTVMESFMGGEVRDVMLDGMPLNKFITKLLDATADQAGEALVHLLGKKYLDREIWKEHK